MATLVPSANIKDSYLPEQTIASNQGTVVFRFAPVASGEVLITLDMVGGSISLATSVLAFSISRAATATSLPTLNWTTPYSTYVTGAPSGLVNASNFASGTNTTYATYSAVLSVLRGVPVYLLVAKNTGTPNSYVKNIKISYDVITGGA